MQGGALQGKQIPLSAGENSRLAAPAMPPAASIGRGLHNKAVRPCSGYTVVKFWCRFFKSDRVQGRALRSFGFGRNIKAIAHAPDYTVVKFWLSFFKSSQVQGRALRGEQVLLSAGENSRLAAPAMPLL